MGIRTTGIITMIEVFLPELPKKSSICKPTSSVLKVVVRDGNRIVGASSALPLIAETSEVQQPFLEHGFDPKTVFYLAQSVLLPAYRGHGLGHRFFEAREIHA